MIEKMYLFHKRPLFICGNEDDLNKISVVRKEEDNILYDKIFQLFLSLFTDSKN